MDRNIMKKLIIQSEHVLNEASKPFKYDYFEIVFSNYINFLTI